MSGMSASLRALAAKGSGGFWVALGVVHIEDGETKHWDVTDDGNVIVSVLLDDGATPTWTLRGSLTRGVRRIPDVGDEVLVAHTQGEVEGIGVIVAVIGDDQLTDESADKTLVIDSEVWVYDGTGIPVELALKSDADALNSRITALETTFNTHVHAGVAPPPSPPGSSTLVPTTPASTSATVAGTTVLKAK